MAVGQSIQKLGHPWCNIMNDFLFFMLLLFRFRHCFAIVMSAVSYYTGDEPKSGLRQNANTRTVNLLLTPDKIHRGNKKCYK